MAQRVNCRYRFQGRMYGSKDELLAALKTMPVEQGIKLGLAGRTPEPPPALTELPDGYTVTQRGTAHGRPQQVRPRTGPVLNQNQWIVRQPDGVVVAVKGTKAEAEREALGKINADRHRAWEQAVPPFPFLKNWLEVAFKDAVMEAARAGKKWLVWTTGEQQAARWNQQIHKHIAAVRYLRLEGTGGPAKVQWALEGWKAGGTALNARAPDFSETVQPEKLADYVGKELAAKMIASPGTIFEGQDLELGGEEFRAIYDTMAVSIARAFAKPWKARVEDVQVQGALAQGGGTPMSGPEPMTMHGLEIVPAMVESIREQGLPLFERRPEPSAEQVDSLVEEARRATIRAGEPDTDHALAAGAAVDLAAAHPVAGLLAPKRAAQAGARRAPAATAGRVPPGLPASAAGPSRPTTPGRGRLLQPPRDYAPLAVPSGVEVVGLGIAAEIAVGPVRLIGRAVGSPEDMARLHQAARDPRFETFRIVALSAPDAQGRRTVLDHVAMSQRLPGSVGTFLGRIGSDGRWTVDSARDFEWLRGWLARVGADRYVMLHNHPSGNADPSDQDISLSAAFQAYLPGLLYHVVIDSQHYALIRPGRVLRRHDEPPPADRGAFHYLRRGRAGHVALVQVGRRAVDVRMAEPEILPLDVPEPLLVPGVPHRFIGESIVQNDTLLAGRLAEMGRALGGPGNDLTVFYTTADWKIRAIERVAPGHLADRERADTYLAARRRALGAAGVLVYAEAGAFPAIQQEAPHMIRAGVIDEFVTVSPGRYQPIRYMAQQLFGRLEETPPAFRRLSARGSQLMESRPPVGGEPPEEPDAETLGDLETLGQHFYTDPQNYEAWATALRPHLPGAYHHLLPELFRHLADLAAGRVDARAWVRRGRGGPRLAGTLNLEHYFENLEDADDLRRLLVDVELPRRAEYERQRRGVIHDDEMEALARESGITVERLIALSPGQAWSPERVRRARQLLATSTDYLNDLKRAAARPEADAQATARFVAHFQRHALIQKAIVGIAAEAGRALREFARPIDPGPGRTAMERWTQIIDTLGGPTRAREAAELLARIPDDELEAINAFTRRAVEPSAHDKFYEYWINAILSGPRTHLVNIFSNFAFGLERGLIDRALAAGIDMVRAKATGGERERWVGEVLAETYAMPLALHEAWAAVGVAWSTGQTSFGAGTAQFIEHRPGAIGTSPTSTAFARRAGEIIRTPTRALMVEDEFFKVFAYRMALHAEAYRQAAREGIEGRARFLRAADLVADPDPPMIERAETEARVRTFTDQGPEWVRTLIRLRDQAGFLKYVIPFIRTPERIFRAAYQRTPLYLLQLGMQEMAYRQELRAARRALATGAAEPIQVPLDLGAGGGGAGAPPTPPRRAGEPEPPDDRERLARLMVQRRPLRGGELSDELAKVMLGTMLAAVGVLMVETGFVTGGGPADARERASWRRVREPYSFWTPWGYVGYKRAAPIGTVFAAIADFTEGFNEKVKKGRAGVTARLVAAVNEVILDQSFITGLRDLGRVFADPYRWAQNWVQGQATSVIPALVRQLVPAVDPTLRAPESIEEAARARVPLLSWTARPRYDHWGEPMMLDPAARASRILLPFDLAFHRDDPADAELLRLHIGLSRPARAAGGLELTDAEYDRYQREGGQAAKQAVLRLIESAAYRALTERGRPDLQIDRIAEVVRNARAAARNRILRDIPWKDRKGRRQAKKEEALHPEVVRQLHEPPDITPPPAD